MRLTVYSDYSLRMLMYLAVMDGKLATISEVADAYGIAKNHLNKVTHQLGLAGFVETLRGRGGGLRLARPAADIRLHEVVRTTEPDMALVPCFEPVRAHCAILPACGLSGALHEAREAFLAVLDRYSLADLVKRRTELATLLNVP
ncbi:Rrf2 family transcriptional regulator [Roseomonas sp. HF4]|uniref:Rrf2 family transcriptional regulator n=1 Tax=Roseomonas sp. HF4 TaxID=2562313 RepID=UPI0010C0360C|nr:Rrf2 family transcriptional regulator [Roseomonas sp. HF4]